MAQTKEVTRIYVVTDSENNYEHIGDIDGGGFEDYWLRNHIKNHGHQGLLDAIAWMTFQVWGMVRQVNMEESNNDSPQNLNNKGNKE
jgi:hypothetical protein